MKCFETRKEMTDAANELVEQLGYEMVRCRLHCKHIKATRVAILILNGNKVVDRFVRCKTCANMKGGANG